MARRPPNSSTPLFADSAKYSAGPSITTFRAAVVDNFDCPGPHLVEAARGNVALVFRGLPGICPGAERKAAHPCNLGDNRRASTAVAAGCGDCQAFCSAGGSCPAKSPRPTPGVFQAEAANRPAPSTSRANV